MKKFRKKGRDGVNNIIAIKNSSSTKKNPNIINKNKPKSITSTTISTIRISQPK